MKDVKGNPYIGVYARARNGDYQIFPHILHSASPAWLCRPEQRGIPSYPHVSDCPDHETTPIAGLKGWDLPALDRVGTLFFRVRNRRRKVFVGK